jgi:hypothetical protein
MKKMVFSLLLSVFAAAPLLACGDLPQPKSDLKAAAPAAGPVLAHKASHKASHLAKAKAAKPALASTDSKQAKI